MSFRRSDSQRQKLFTNRWYKTPKTEATALEQGYDRVIQFWKPREAGEDVIEALPGTIFLSDAPTDIVMPRLRRTKLPDASLSPYFGLERHLTQRTTQTRQDILANLDECGSHVIVGYPAQLVRAPAPSSTLRTTRIQISHVQATDLFGMSQDLASPQQCCEGPALRVESQTPERAYDFDLIVDEIEPQNHTEESASGNSDSPDADSVGLPRARKESWCLADRRIHDVVASQLPRFATAKVMKDAIIRMKGLSA